MKKITLIEGLRGYLAVWVLLSHVFISTGCVDIKGPLKLITDGPLAVQCFMIISGFVIFFLLDSKKETYGIFITRRFFRIYPVYILLFLISIPTSRIWEYVFIQTRDLGWYSNTWVNVFSNDLSSLSSGYWFHILAHLLLLHGLVPNLLLPGGATAFLEPAWSLSLEWQFYLIAPFLFYLFVAKPAWKQVGIFGMCFAAVVFSRRFLPHVEMNAALPFCIEYFFLGGACYALYKAVSIKDMKSDKIFLSILMISLAMFKVSEKNVAIIPFLLWALFFGLLLEPPSSFSSKIFAPIFSNRFSMWLGKISYSIYLSHTIVIVFVKWWLLLLLPSLTQQMHLMMLSVLATILTILLSAILYYGVEAPFIRLGNKMVARKSEKLEAPLP